MERKLIGNFSAKLAVLILCLLVPAFAVSAQRKPVRKAPAKSPAAAPATAAEIRAGAEKVSTQIKNVSKFVYLLGGIANNIEAMDADIRAKKVTRKESIDLNNKNKQSVITGIQNLRAGLAALETEFTTKPSLKLYNINIQGVSNLAGNAESQASSGQFTESGKTLLTIIEKLSDELVALP